MAPPSRLQQPCRDASFGADVTCEIYEKRRFGKSVVAKATRASHEALGLESRSLQRVVAVVDNARNRWFIVLTHGPGYDCVAPRPPNYEGNRKNSAGVIWPGVHREPAGGLSTTTTREGQVAEETNMQGGWGTDSMPRGMACQKTSNRHAT
ncbi:hypothetical protein CKAH01_10395 [Colletotrichum kahawae]|uniref:Uncharacterized protein n=1 Tax=Colletotrichum kahawae TaxID=34407 RepID=A0AAD9XXE4_COLKA|nr:hypothetical protein CKAH01_10395 [Colletotrichum kahawae]